MLARELMSLVSVFSPTSSAVGKSGPRFLRASELLISDVLCKPVSYLDDRALSQVQDFGVVMAKVFIQTGVGTKLTPTRNHNYAYG